MAGNTATPRASVIARAFDVLGCFDEQHRMLSQTALAQRSGLPLPTVHRLCAALVGVGALARRDSGEYVIGRRIWTSGLLAPVQTGLREVASPFLHDLYAATRSTVHLAVREGTQVLYLDRLAGHESVPVVSRIGGRLPLHCTGVGKVLLAHAPTDVIATVLSSLHRATPFTVVQPRTLLAQLDRVRRDGYATTTDEMTMGASSVAVPVVRRTPGGEEVVASLAIVVSQLKRDRPRLVAALQVAAQGVGRSLSR